MALFEGKTPAERNKTIAAIAFGLVAILLLGRMFFGSSGSTSNTNVNRSRAGATRGGASGAASGDAQDEEQIVTVPRPVEFRQAAYTGGDAGRNIFALFTRPAAPVATQTPEVELPPATPTPPPPIRLDALSPPSVYAQTGEFRMQVSGDKFTPESRVYVNEQEVPTQFVSAQQLTANVPAFQISSPGARTIIVHTPDRVLYSNTATLNVMQPPLPQYTYIGYVQRRDGQEFATLRDQGNKQKMYRLNEVVGKELQGGERFRITGISPKIVELTDTELKIKHPLNYDEASRASGNPAMRNSIPPPKAEDNEDGDEEP